MKKYINCDEAESYLENLAMKSGNEDMQFALMWAAKHISEMLPAEVSERTRGHWVNVCYSVTGTSSADCSVCGATIHDSFSKHINFCPNCGADNRDYKYEE